MPLTEMAKQAAISGLNRRLAVVVRLPTSHASKYATTIDRQTGLRI